MAREPVAVDFMGLGNNNRLGSDNKESDRSQGDEADRVTLVKPIASVPEKKPVVGMSRFVTVSETERAVDRENSISRLRQGISSSPLGRSRPPVGGRDEEMQGGILFKRSEKVAFEKPLEELTDSDILQLTREDCRRYLKERGMQKPSWNKQEVIQQIFSLRYHSDPRGEDEKLAKREPTDGPHHIPSPSLSEGEHTMTSGPSHPHVSKEGLTGRFSDVQAHTRTSLFANGFQAPSVVSNTTSQMSSFGEEAQTGTKHSKCAGANSHLSLPIPATHQHQPIVSNVSGFGTPLPAFHGVTKTNSTTDRAVATNGQWPSQMQVGNMQGSTLSSRLAHTNGMEVNQCTSQLTIFYAGMVNVYDDIPIEKVQSIMLLAGNAKTWSSNQKNAPTNVISSSPFSAPMPIPQPSTASPAPPTTTAGAVSIPAVPPPEVQPAVIASALRQPTTRNVHIELPQARKASLARFLEKRKDRVRSKGPYAPKLEGSPTPPRERSPSPPSNKPQSRSQSPVMTSRMQKQLLSPTAVHHQCTSTGGEPNSPTIPSGTLVKRISIENQSTENSA